MSKSYDYSQNGGLLVAKQDKILTITLNSPENLKEVPPAAPASSEVASRCATPRLRRGGC